MKIDDDDNDATQQFEDEKERAEEEAKGRARFIAMIFVFTCMCLCLVVTVTDALKSHGSPLTDLWYCLLIALVGAPLIYTASAHWTFINEMADARSVRLIRIEAKLDAIQDKVTIP